jgi:hypothetical protein
MKNKIEKLKKFIKDNNLEFNSGSGGDINILALCGYACYIGATSDDCIETVNSSLQEVDDEINRVFDYAFKNKYAKFWETEKARKQWKF